MAFTDKYIDSLKPSQKIVDVREGNGFGIRILPSGVKTWFFIYRFDGKRRFLNLGHYPHISLKEARKQYREAYDLYEQGKDPLHLAQQEAEKRAKALSVDDLVKEYIMRHAKRFKRSWEEDARILNKEVVPTWGKRKAEDVTKRDVIHLLDRIVDRGSPAMANNTFQIIRKMFNFATEKDILTHSPCTGIKLPSPRVSKDRTLSEAEIFTFWTNLDKCAMAEYSRRALKLILVTAQRPGEVAEMHADEIDGRWWTIPTERAKNGQAQRVYLTDTALELIGDIDGKGYIFPSPHKEKERSINDHALAVAVLRSFTTPVVNDKGKPIMGDDGKPKLDNKMGTERFTPHDLRRSAATFMAGMGTMDEVIDAVLNHAKRGVVKVYNQYRYDREKQAALEAWERKLKQILNGKTQGNVVPMKRKAANGEAA